MIAPDVGGGFGSKLNVYAEEALALALAKRIGRPVKWIEERSEGYLATIHGRDQWQEMEYAADEDGKIRGVRAKLVVGLGAYLQLVTAGTPILGGWVYGGPLRHRGVLARGRRARSPPRRRPTPTAAPAGRRRRT